MMNCLDLDQAHQRVQMRQSDTLRMVSDLEDYQAGLDAAAAWLNDVDTTLVRRAAERMRLAAEDLRIAEEFLAAANNNRRLRNEAARLPADEALAALNPPTG